MKVEIDVVCLSILKILNENQEGLGISVLDRKLYDELGYSFGISLNFRIGDKLQELKQLEMISKTSPYEITVIGKKYLEKIK